MRYRVRELQQFLKSLKVAVNFIPIQSQIFMYKDIAKSGNRCNAPGKGGIEDAQFACADNGVMGVDRFFGFFKRYNPVADIYYALGSHFEVALHNIAQIGVFIEFSPVFFL